MKTILISVGLTVFLGPGVGHLYLKQFKKAALLIIATLLTAVHLAWRVGRAIMSSAVITADNAFQVMQDFGKQHPRVMLVYDAILAAIWAYAVVDAYLTARQRSRPSEEQDTTT